MPAELTWRDFDFWMRPDNLGAALLVRPSLSRPIFFESGVRVPSFAFLFAAQNGALLLVHFPCACALPSRACTCVPKRNLGADHGPDFRVCRESRAAQDLLPNRDDFGAGPHLFDHREPRT